MEAQRDQHRSCHTRRREEQDQKKTPWEKTCTASGWGYCRRAAEGLGRKGEDGIVSSCPRVERVEGTRVTRRFGAVPTCMWGDFLVCVCVCVCVRACVRARAVRVCVYMCGASQSWPWVFVMSDENGRGLVHGLSAIPGGREECRIVALPDGTQCCFNAVPILFNVACCMLHAAGCGLQTACRMFSC